MTGPLSVLLVDDSAPIRRLARYALETDARYIVVAEASTGVEALRLAAAHAPDVVVLDLGLDGDSGGLERIADLRAVAPATRVVVFSGHSEEAYGERARRAGADGFLHKGGDVFRLPTQLTAALAGIPQRRVPVSGPAA